jgi:hypothetical protein
VYEDPNQLPAPSRERLAREHKSLWLYNMFKKYRLDITDEQWEKIVHGDGYILNVTKMLEQLKKDKWEPRRTYIDAIRLDMLSNTPEWKDEYLNKFSHLFESEKDMKRFNRLLKLEAYDQLLEESKNPWKIVQDLEIPEEDFDDDGFDESKWNFNNDNYVESN